MAMIEVSCKAVAMQNSSEWPCSMCPFPQLRLVGGSRTWCPGNIRKIYKGCPHPHKPEPGGMGHMEQGHAELFWVATALQLTPGMVI